MVGRGGLNVPDLLAAAGVGKLSEGVFTDEGPFDGGPAEVDGPASPLPGLMGVPSAVVALGWFLKIGGATRVEVNSFSSVDVGVALLVCDDSSHLLALSGGLSLMGMT